MSASRRRLAVVLSHPTQYYSPWFRWMTDRRSVELRVFYLWDFGLAPRRDPQFQVDVQWDVDLTSGYEWESVPNRARDPGTHHFAGLRNPTLTARLAAWQPEAVLVFGYPWLSHLRAIAWARWHGVPLIFRGDSHFIGRPHPGWRRLWLLRLLYRQFAAVTFVGAANRRYFQRLGVPDSRLFFAPHAVDAARFDPSRPEYSAQARALREALRLEPDARIVLFAGKWVPGKQPVQLLEAFLELSPERTVLVFVGEGPERARLESLAAARPGAAVRLLPFANQSEMPSRYALADVFALPSAGLSETWGLAVNEAMHMGVPCLVSDHVGCAEDLVVPGETGWVFSAAQPGGLREALAQALRAVADPQRRAALSTAARSRAARYTYGPATTGLLRALASLPPA